VKILQERCDDSYFGVMGTDKYKQSDARVSYYRDLVSPLSESEL